MIGPRGGHTLPSDRRWVSEPEVGSINSVGLQKMTTRNAILFALLLHAVCLTSCSTFGSRRHAGISGPAVFDIVLHEVDLQNANVVDTMTYLQDQVVEKIGDESLNLIIVPQGIGTNWPYSWLTYHATNVSVRNVFAEVHRQTGLVTEFIRDATVVASPETLARIRTIPPLITPTNGILASKLERHIECWEDCTVTMQDVAHTLHRFLGVKADATDTIGVPRIFCSYRADIRNMRWSTWLWWVSVLSDTQITYVGDTVKITRRKPNQGIQPTN